MENQKYINLTFKSISYTFIASILFKGDRKNHTSTSLSQSKTEKKKSNLYKDGIRLASHCRHLSRHNDVMKIRLECLPLECLFSKILLSRTLKNDEKHKTCSESNTCVL